MVTFILIVLGLTALRSVFHTVKYLHALWIGEDAIANFTIACIMGLALVFEVQAFQWLWYLDDRFDLNALAQSAGI